MKPLRSRNRERSGRHNHDNWRQLYQLQSTSLFGFMARNQTTMSSDVDVWVELELLRDLAQDNAE